MDSLLIAGCPPFLSLKNFPAFKKTLGKICLKFVIFTSRVEHHLLLLSQKFSETDEKTQKIGLYRYHLFSRGEEKEGIYIDIVDL